MMIDFALQAEREGGKAPKTPSSKRACCVPPHLMTTMLPSWRSPAGLWHGTGSELRRPLGISIVGGLIMSSFYALTPLGRLSHSRQTPASRSGKEVTLFIPRMDQSLRRSLIKWNDYESHSPETFLRLHSPPSAHGCMVGPKYHQPPPPCNRASYLQKLPARISAGQWKVAQPQDAMLHGKCGNFQRPD